MNTLKIRVENPEELLAAGHLGAGALIRVERSATETGTYTEQGTIPIAAGTYAYTYYDSGATGSWYRVRYSKSNGTAPSDYSDPFQAAATISSYCSIYDVKQRLGISPTDAADDEELLQHIEQVAGFIESRTRRRLYPLPDTSFTFDGYSATHYGQRLPVPQGVRSVSSVTMADSTGGTPVALAATDYLIRPLPQDRDPGWPGTELWLADNATFRMWSRAYSNIVVTGTFGWADVPREIEALALRLVVDSWRGRSSGVGDVFTIGADGERTFARLLSWEDKRTLSSYSVGVLVA